MTLVALLILGLYLLALWRRPEWMTLSWLALAATVLTVFIGTVGGYVANLPVDYRRFPYFLYLPLIVALLLFLDLGLASAMRTRAPRRLPAPVAGSGGCPPHLAGRSPGGDGWNPSSSPSRWSPSSCRSSSTPSRPGTVTKRYYTEFGHDQDFVNVVNGLEATGIPGNILSTTPLVGHWPSTLTTRTTYDPAALGGNWYASSQVIRGRPRRSPWRTGSL